MKISVEKYAILKMTLIIDFPPKNPLNVEYNTLLYVYMGPNLTCTTVMVQVAVVVLHFILLT